MKILLTGGGTGGHFYPLIAIAEKLNEIAEQDKIIDMKLYYMSDDPYDKRMLFENGITFVKIPSGKMRRYFSVKNFSDMIKAAIGAGLGLVTMFFIYPDVVVSKGGYSAFPAVFAARLLRIPVIIHESDSSPGRMNLWSAKFAKRIAVSWAEAGEYFPKDKTILTGQPIRKEILHAIPEDAFEFFKLNSNVPVLFIAGGSQGAEVINNSILEVLPELVSRYQIIHQTGVKNIDDCLSRSKLVLEGNINAGRYMPMPYLNNLNTRMAAGAATLIISRAGSFIFEIASWGVPSIIIPIINSNGDHQRHNAFNYARTGACIVIEENNLTPHVLMTQIDNLTKDKNKLATMKSSALAFANLTAALKIAKEAVEIASSHES